MSKISEAIVELHKVDMESRKNGWLQNTHPLAKLLVSFAFLVFLLSCGKYQLEKVLLLGSYLVISYTLGNISIRRLWKRMKPIFLLVCLIGIANPFLDRRVLFQIAGIAVTGGMISMLTLLCKGLFAVAGAYLLMVTTGMDDLCYALSLLHIPKVLIKLLLLVYRYLIVFLKEIERMLNAYAMRAPGQEGLHYQVWGSMIGQLLLRSMDRAQDVYDSMTLRGYQGEFYLRCKKKAETSDWLFVFVWLAVFLLLRIVL